MADVQWCEDPTNSDRSTPRGRLRQDVIPILRELWSSADRHAANASSLLHSAVDAFDSIIPHGTSWSRDTLQKLPLSIIAATIHNSIGNHATYETIQSIAKAIVDDNTEPRTFVCKNGYVANVTTHKVEILHT
jgi:hypothetical protein